MGALFTLLPTILALINNPEVQKVMPLIQQVLDQLGKQTYPTVDPAKAASAGASLFDASNTRWVQVALNLLGIEKVEIDGIPGEATKAAVKKYQLSKNLVADGYAGAVTVAAMQKDLLGK